MCMWCTLHWGHWWPLLLSKTYMMPLGWCVNNINWYKIKIYIVWALGPERTQWSQTHQRCFVAIPASPVYFWLWSVKKWLYFYGVKNLRSSSKTILHSHLADISNSHQRISFYHWEILNWAVSETLANIVPLTVYQYGILWCGWDDGCLWRPLRVCHFVFRIGTSRLLIGLHHRLNNDYFSYFKG